MHNLLRILSLWIQLSYGEILKTIPPGKKIFFFLLLILIHALLILALFLPGTIWGIYCCAISGLFLVWNISLDQYSGSIFRPLRNHITLWEKKAQTFSPNSSWEKGIKFLGEYLRIHIPLVIGLLAAIIIAFC